MELANESDLRLTSPVGLPAEHGDAQSVTGSTSASLDHRLPMPGTLLTRDYKGRTVVVKVLENGFEYDDQIHQSLSSVAKTVTGSHWNGFHFFGLAKQGAKS